MVLRKCLFQTNYRNDLSGDPYISFLKVVRLCYHVGVVQSLSRVWLATLWTAAHQAFLSFAISWSFLKVMSIESVMPSKHLILCRSLLLLPSIFPSIRVFSNESALRIRWPKYWSFSFSISPSNEYPGLTSFRIDWFDLLAVQGTLRSLLQQHNSSAVSLLYGTALTSVHGYCRNHSSDYTDLILASYIFLFPFNLCDIFSLNTVSDDKSTRGLLYAFVNSRWWL